MPCMCSQIHNGLDEASFKDQVDDWGGAKSTLPPSSRILAGPKEAMHVIWWLAAMMIWIIFNVLDRGPRPSPAVALPTAYPKYYTEVQPCRLQDSCIHASLYSTTPQIILLFDIASPSRWVSHQSIRKFGSSIQ